MDNAGQLTSERIWRVTVIAALIDAPLVLLIGWRVSSEHVFPSWSRGLLPAGYGMQFGASAAGLWYASATFTRWQAGWICLAGGGEKYAKKGCRGAARSSIPFLVLLTPGG